MNQDMPDAILMVADSLTVLNRKRVFEFAAARKLPAIYEYDFLVRDGGLMSYGPDLTESFERASALVDRIFKGCQARRSAFRAADPLPLRDQSEDRKEHWPGNSPTFSRLPTRSSVRRREFINACRRSVMPSARHAPVSKRRYRIGFLGNSTEALEASLVGHFARRSLVSDM